MRFMLVILGLLACPAYAGELSHVGDAIEVESYRCEVVTPYRIECTDIGRVCEKFRAEEKSELDKSFGCAIEGSKNAPCPPWEEQMKRSKKNRDLFMRCMSLSLGAL